MNLLNLKNSGKFVLTAHAKERIRQRVGISATEAALAWVNEAIAASTEFFEDKGRKHHHFLTDTYDIVCDNLRVVTVKPRENHNDYVSKFGGLLQKEVDKLLTIQHRELRKAEIKVAELTLNFLKAKSPKVRSTIQRNLTKATDERAKLEDEIKAIEIAAKRYGVTV